MLKFLGSLKTYMYSQCLCRPNNGQLLYSPSPWFISERHYASVIFLIAFNPVIELIQTLSSPALPLLHLQLALPLIDEPNSSEPPGQYKCMRLDYNGSGKALFQQLNGEGTSIIHEVDLCKIICESLPSVRGSSSEFYPGLR